MIDVWGDLFEYPANAMAITTNGYTRKSDGFAVMGRGCARQAAERWPGLQMAVGAALRTNGNHVFCFRHWEGLKDLITFPVKDHWRTQANPFLIARSCQEAMAMADHYDWEVCVLPRPGCGNGHLDYETTVRPLIEPLLDDRFHVITWESP